MFVGTWWRFTGIKVGVVSGPTKCVLGLEVELVCYQSEGFILGGVHLRKTVLFSKPGLSRNVSCCWPICSHLV